MPCMPTSIPVGDYYEPPHNPTPYQPSPSQPLQLYYDYDPVYYYVPPQVVHSSYSELASYAPEAVSACSVFSASPSNSTPSPTVTTPTGATPDPAIKQAEMAPCPVADNPLDIALEAPQAFFPTPSELLADLNAREQSSRHEAERHPSVKRSPGSSSSRRKKEPVDKPDNLNQRKAYFRSVSENVGFTITDPYVLVSTACVEPH